jgi:hypothetical protein
MAGEEPILDPVATRKRFSSIYGQHCIQQGYHKDKATIAFNVSDIFNSRKRRSETNLPSVATTVSFNGERQFNLSFTYRIQRKQTEIKCKNNDDDGGY